MFLESLDEKKDRFDKEKIYWEKFSEARTGKELETFGDLIEKAENHKHAINKNLGLNTFQDFAMSILLEQEKEIEKMEEKINKIKHDLEEIQN